MRTTSRSRIGLALLAGFGLAIAPPALAQPRKKPAPATQEDIERLEKKITEQQQVLEKLMRLHQQYLQSVTTLLGGTTAPQPAGTVTTTTTPTPTPDKPVQPDVTGPKTIPAVVKVAPVKPKKAEGVGTIVGKVAGAGDAIVYIETINAPAGGSAAMKQEGKQFVPQVLIVTKGTTVEFPNRDAIFHNVFSVTPDHTFDLGSYRQGESKSVKMSRPGVLTVYCNMHPQMVGHILVTPNANYVRAGKDGFFRLSNVPAGQHRVVAWAPNAKPVSVAANVVDAEVVTIELALKKGRGSPHTKKDGLPYGSYGE